MRFLKVIFSTIIIILAIVFIMEHLDNLKHPVTLGLDLYVVRLQSPAIPPVGAGPVLFLLWGPLPPPFTASTRSYVPNARPSASSNTTWRFWPKS